MGKVVGRGSKWHNRDLAVGIDLVKNAYGITKLEVDRTILTRWNFNYSTQAPYPCQTAKPANRNVH